MSKMTRYQSTRVSAALDVESNPDGKGLNGFLLDWHGSQPRGIAIKPDRQLLAEYFTSLLVLTAAFKFKPVVGARYYLYWLNDEWALSLIAPEEWTEARNAAFAGRCELHADMTWTINPSEQLADNASVSAALRGFYAGFVEKLSSAEPLENELPIYVRELPYYQRLYASALSRSLQGSLRQGGQTGVSSEAWLKKLPRRAERLLQGQGSGAP